MDTTNYKPVTVGNWMLTYLLICIPLVNLIMLLIWAFGENTPVSKSNWAKASLLWMVLGFALSVGLFILTGAGAIALGGV